jgi:hypothetical protein
VFGFLIDKSGRNIFWVILGTTLTIGVPRITYNASKRSRKTRANENLIIFTFVSRITQNTLHLPWQHMG